MYIITKTISLRFVYYWNDNLQQWEGLIQNATSLNALDCFELVDNFIKKGWDIEYILHQKIKRANFVKQHASASERLRFGTVGGGILIFGVP